MSEEMRRGVVAALAVLAGSPDHRDRADAGRVLGSFAEIPEARGPLSTLVLDPGDPSVVGATMEGLLRRQDAVGVRVVAAALGTADPDQFDRIHQAPVDAFRVFGPELDREATIKSAWVLVGGDDEDLSRGADMLISLVAMLAVLEPDD